MESLTSFTLMESIFQNAYGVENYLNLTAMNDIIPVTQEQSNEKFFNT